MMIKIYRSGAAGETTSTTLSWWTLAMIAFPEVQRRAQAELDNVIGRDRLPTFADAPHLPYVSAVIREVLRWRPALPIGVPHAAMEDDWYENMFIPKGSVCISNVWHCNHDRAVFGEDADDFRPERHLDEQGRLSSGPVETNRAGHTTFGFGRRVCVGKELAADSLFIHTARILWAANLERRRDKNANEMPLDLETLVNAGLIVWVLVLVEVSPWLTLFLEAALLRTVVWLLHASQRCCLSSQRNARALRIRNKHRKASTVPQSRL
jgi:cytochrome P450